MSHFSPARIRRGNDDRRIIKGPRLVRVEPMHMQYRLTKHIDFQAWRAERGIQVDQLATRSCAGAAAAPGALAEHSINRRHHYRAYAAGRRFDPRPAWL